MLITSQPEDFYWYQKVQGACTVLLVRHLWSCEQTRPTIWWCHHLAVAAAFPTRREYKLRARFPRREQHFNFIFTRNTRLSPFSFQKFVDPGILFLRKDFQRPI